MNDLTPAPLDTFETALLAELRSQVASSDPTEAPLSPVSELCPHRKRRRITAVAASAAGIVAASLAVHSLLPTPAYAVTGSNTTKIKVHVMRLEGADGLERALAKKGIKSDITYLPAGKICSPGRYTDAPPSSIVISIGSDEFWLTIPARSVKDGDTLVMSAAVAPFGKGVRVWIDSGVARGPVAPCQVIDAP